MVHDSSWVILVTDSNHLLSRAERNFLNDYAGKPNVDVIVNLLPGTAKEEIKSEIELLENDVLMMDFTNDDNSDLLNNKLQKLSESKEVIKQAERFSDIKTFGSKKKELDISENNLKSILKQLKSLGCKIQAKQDQLLKNFTEFDLVVLEQDLADLVTGFNTFFKNYSFWKLGFKSDYLAQDLQLVLRDYSLMNGELQVLTR